VAEGAGIEGSPAAEAFLMELVLPYILALSL
jgi:hypothetical protein